MSCNADFNYFILQQEGKSVEFWYLDSFAKLFYREGGSMSLGDLHNYYRGIVLSHFGNEMLRGKMIMKLESVVQENLHAWSELPSVEVKEVATKMIFDFTTGQLFGYEPSKSSENLSEKFSTFMQGLFSIPLNIPGTMFHTCLKNKKLLLDMVRSTMKERRVSPNKCRGDLLDHLMDDMKKHSFLTEDIIVNFVFAITITSFAANSSSLLLAIKFLTENSFAMSQLKEEHQAILQSREVVNSSITWNEYKTMNFTSYVISETLRFLSPGLLRRATKDVIYNGYTIPKGWTIYMSAAAVNLNPYIYENPLEFNPWRWKDLKSNVTVKNYIVFGGGGRLCTGSEFSKVFMTVFLHVLVTKYSWKLIKGGNIVRKPILVCKDGLHIQVSKMSCTN